MRGATGIIRSSLSTRVIQMNERAPIGRTRTSKSALLSIVTIACWTMLLVIVLSSVFASSKLSKQLRSKEIDKALGAKRSPALGATTQRQ
jgi:hypothetical protein